MSPTLEWKRPGRASVVMMNSFTSVSFSDRPPARAASAMSPIEPSQAIVQCSCSSARESAAIGVPRVVLRRAQWRQAETPVHVDEENEQEPGGPSYQWCRSCSGTARRNGRNPVLLARSLSGNRERRCVPESPSACGGDLGGNEWGCMRNGRLMPCARASGHLRHPALSRLEAATASGLTEAARKDIREARRGEAMFRRTCSRGRRR